MVYQESCELGRRQHFASVGEAKSGETGVLRGLWMKTAMGDYVRYMCPLLNLIMFNIVGKNNTLLFNRPPGIVTESES